jgi:hypothetical protein
MVLKLRQVTVTMNGEMVRSMSQTATGYFVVFCERFVLSEQETFANQKCAIQAEI